MIWVEKALRLVQGQTMTDQDKSQSTSEMRQKEPPAMGERRARWGYGYQDKVATDRILQLLREDLRLGQSDFEGIRLADLDAGRVDDFVLVWKDKVEGNSIKSSRKATPLNWGDLIGKNGLLKELAEGYQRLKDRWPNKSVFVRLQSNCPPSSEKHHTQVISAFSISQFLKDHWALGPTTSESRLVTTAWSKISEHVNLKESDFSEFIKHCNISLGFPEPPGIGQNSYDWRQYKKQFDDLHKAIATWLINNPDGEFIDRNFLLSAIGFQKHRTGLIQRFPPPKIPYSKNKTSAIKLKNLINSTAGGYIAVVGPAGVGKSTLVQDVLSNDNYPYFIPYYSFLPESNGNRDRGEALTFFQDVIGRLDKFFPGRRSLGISDISQGREALLAHIKRANEQYTTSNRKTILLVDGLDHVAQEINLKNSLLYELPNPNEVLDGFLIILSSQPQALIPGTITASVGNVLDPQSSQRITVSGLSRKEVHKIVSKIGKVTTSSEKDALYEACNGNPLILTYLVNIFHRTSETSVKEAIKLAGEYKGDIAEYYKSSLSVYLQDIPTRKLLGLLCRAAPTLPVAWLQQWPESDALESAFERILAPFIQEEDGNLSFIHNSLIAYLKSETRSRLSGADLSSDERSFHSMLADRCGERPCIDLLGRAKVFHLLRSDRIPELLDVLGAKPSETSSNWLRQAAEEFLPYAHIRPLILSGFESAWNLEEFGQVLRLILLDYELDIRSSRVSESNLSNIVLKLDKPGLAISQIQASGRLLVEDIAAISFSRKLWYYAKSKRSLELETTARKIYFQSKPLSLFHLTEDIDTWHHSKDFAILEVWSRSAPLFEDVNSIIKHIRGLNFKASQQKEPADDKSAEATLYYNVLLTLIRIQAGIDPCRLIISEISTLNQPSWLFPAVLNLANHCPSSVSATELRAAYTVSGRNDDIDLAFAEFLYDQGCYVEAKEIVKELKDVQFKGSQNDHSFGFSDVSYTSTLGSLRELLGITIEVAPDINNEEDETLARIETTAKKIGVLLASVKSRNEIQDLRKIFRSFFLFHNHAIKFPNYSLRNDYVMTRSRMDIYRETLKLACAIGKQGLEVIRDVFLELTRGSAGVQFLPCHRRYFAEELYHYQFLSKQQAIDLILSNTMDAEEEDPNQRQDACFEIATCLHSIGDCQLSSQWLKRAGKVSIGAGSHKDYHMANLADWLVRSIGNDLNDKKLHVTEKFARAAKVAGGDGASYAATHLLQLILQSEPMRSYSLAIEFIDRNVLNISSTLESLIVGGHKLGHLQIYC